MVGFPSQNSGCDAGDAQACTNWVRLRLGAAAARRQEAMDGGQNPGLAHPRCPSPDPQYPIPFEPHELSFRHMMLLLRHRKLPREPRALANRFEPGIAQHGGVAKEPAAYHTLKKFKRGIVLVQACEMPRQIKEPFGVAELGSEDAPDRGNARWRISLDHRPGGHDEIAESRLALLFESQRHPECFVLAPQLG